MPRFSRIYTHLHMCRVTYTADTCAHKVNLRNAELQQSNTQKCGEHTQSPITATAHTHKQQHKLHTHTHTAHMHEQQHKLHPPHSNNVSNALVCNGNYSGCDRSALTLKWPDSKSFLGGSDTGRKLSSDLAGHRTLSSMLVRDEWHQGCI